MEFEVFEGCKSGATAVSFAAGVKARRADQKEAGSAVRIHVSIKCIIP